MRLPHFYERDRWLFVTFCLHGSLPVGRYPGPRSPRASEAFRWMDSCLDQAVRGPLWLKRPELAGVVAGELVRGEGYELGAWVVMANHVHALLLPRVSLAVVMNRLKGRTARALNLALGRTGLPVWQRESYDRLVRDDAEFRRIWSYVENNPVAAGLVSCAEEYRWSSAWPSR